MRRYLLATLAAVALAGGSASAADLARPVPRAAPVAAPVVKWTGPYFGATVGYSWGTVKNEFTASTPLGGGIAVFSSESQDVDGFIGGITSGINWQVGAWVWGLEHDISVSGQEGDTTYPLLGTLSVTADHRLRWFGTARSRLGFLWADWVLVYGTAGVAYGQLRSDYTFNVGLTQVATANLRETRAGYAVGAGIEGALGGGWTAKLEYLYIDLGKDEVTATVTGLAAATLDRKFHDHIVRVGLNWRWL